LIGDGTDCCSGIALSCYRPQPRRWFLLGIP